MKVNIYETVEVSDEQRKQIASVVDKKPVKRQATRDEIKAFVWERGSDWQIQLEAAVRSQASYGEEPEPDPDDIL